jgi:hypothetical protein
MQKTMLLVLLLTCASAHALEWVHVVSSKTTEFLVDVSGIKVSGVIRQAWIKKVIKPLSVRDPDPRAHRWENEVLERNAFDCKEETWSNLAITVYYDDGTNQSLSAGTPQSDWQTIVPDSVFADVIRFVCEWKPK